MLMSVICRKNFLYWGYEVFLLFIIVPTCTTYISQCVFPKKKCTLMSTAWLTRNKHLSLYSSLYFVCWVFFPAFTCILVEANEI